MPHVRLLCRVRRRWIRSPITSPTQHRRLSGRAQCLQLGAGNAGGSGDTALNQAINNYGVMSGTTLDQSQGALQKTGNELDMGIEGPGLLCRSNRQRSDVHAQRRFQVSSKGQFVTAPGRCRDGRQGRDHDAAGTSLYQRRWNHFFEWSGCRQTEASSSFPRAREPTAWAALTTPRRRKAARRPPIRSEAGNAGKLECESDR